MDLLFITIRFLDILDILLFAFLLYQVYILIRGTTAINIFAGVFALYLLWLFVKALNMQLLSSILGQFIGVGVIALIIVFQPELRKGLLLLGSRQFSQERFSFLKYFTGGSNYTNRVKIREIVTACRSLSMTKTGALIVFQKNSNLSSYLQIKDILNADTSSRLLVNIFVKNSPLHDGAVVIIGPKIYAARCVLPISEAELPGNLGMRHRAALGITEQSDAAVIVVSEETGNISFVKEGKLNTDLTTKDLSSILEAEFVIESTRQSPLERIFNIR
jgi:diadenylate cyclase